MALSVTHTQTELIHSVKGFTVSGVAAGFRKSGKLDLSIIASDVDCTAAAVFTTNQVKAAPVLVNIERITNNPEKIRAIVTNSAIANACTGEQGLENAYKTAELVAEQLDIAPEQVLVLSTGVIGRQLPMDIMESGIPLAVEVLNSDSWLG